MKNALSYQAFLKSPYKSRKYSTYFQTYDYLFKKYRELTPADSDQIMLPSQKIYLK
tara:strand:+ start:502 stop:669 length:168 start_codon:yes stop_codon:yes gene_type:complete